MIAFHQRTFLNPKHAGVGGGGVWRPPPSIFYRGLIGSAVLTFIGYKQTNKQTNKQTDKPNLYIDVGPKYIAYDL